MALKPKNVLGTTGVLTRRALKENVNTGVAVGKKATVATRATSGTQRSVLGNISNAPAQLPARQDAFEVYKEPKVPLIANILFFKAFIWIIIWYTFIAN